MTRMGILLAIGVFMLSLVVLAGVEWDSDVPVKTEGQMVTGTIDKQILSGEEMKNIVPGDMPARRETSSAGGVLVPLDNGTLRGESGSFLDMTGGRAGQTSGQEADAQPHEGKGEPSSAASDPAAAVPDLPAVPKPVETVPDHPVTPENTEAKPASTAQPANSNNVTTGTGSRSAAFTLTAAAPVLNPGQKGASSSLKIGKDIVFRVQGSGPMKADTLLLNGPDRFVVDVQGNWGIGIPKVPAGLWLKGIRQGRAKDTTRIVFDLGRKPKAATARNIDAKTIEVTIR